MWFSVSDVIRWNTSQGTIEATEKNNQVKKRLKKVVDKSKIKWYTE